MSSDQYFATLDTEEVGKAIDEKIQDFYRKVETMGYFHIIRKMYHAYYGSDVNQTSSGRLFQSHAIGRGGVQGETYDFKVNEFRNLVQHLIVMTTSERPALEAMAINSDYDSQAQAELANGLLEYYITKKRLDRDFVQAVEYGVALAGGFIVLDWDTSLGRQYAADPESGRVYNEGDISCEPKHQLDVIFDAGLATIDDAKWKAVRFYKNKWDLAVEYEGLRIEILRSSDRNNSLDRFSFTHSTGEQDSDMIAVFQFYHERTPAVPDGRMVLLLEGGQVLFDGPLPYKEVPIYRIRPASIVDSPFGYSPAMDLLSIQEALDRLNSAVLTNQASFGIQNIWLPKGHNISVQSLEGGLNVIESEMGMKPEPLNLTSTPPELFKYLEILSGKAEQIVGLNSIVRGQPQGQLSGASGAAMALLASQAIQFSHGLQREHESLIEDVGTAMIDILKQYANTQRVAIISGKSNSGYIKEFSGQDIDKVDRVVVKRTSALSKTTAGKSEIAKDLLNSGMIESGDQYLTVLSSGTLDPMTEGPRSEMLNIKAENEFMKEGRQPRALSIDDHQKHIREHASLVNDPTVRDQNPELVEIVMGHIEEHMNLARNTDPDLLNMLGIQPLQPLQQPPAQAGAPASDILATQGEALGEELPNQPSMPNDPMTGEEFEPAVPGAIPPAI